MPFVKGQSGNPAGRPRGCRNRANRDLDVELDAEASYVARSFVAQARDGNPTAMRLVARRVLPVGRERPVEIDLPPLGSTEDRPAAVDVIRQALCEGEITIVEAIGLIKFVDQAIGLDQPVARGRAETNELRGEIANLRGTVATLIGRIDVLRRISGVEESLFGGPAPLGVDPAPEEPAPVNINENTSAADQTCGAAGHEINENDEINEINEINAESMSTPSAPAPANPADRLD